MNNTPNRKARRNMYKQAGMLKAKEQIGHFSPEKKEWYKKMREEGEKIHEMNTRDAQDQIENQLQIILDRQKETWAELGYNEAEIALLEESWTLLAVKDKETYREDKKKSRELSKQANQLRLARKEQ
jgi:hypothetical protein